MAVRWIKVDPRKPDRSELGGAARLLRQGALVAFPTETVYGLGAHASLDDAVDRVYLAKGRPRTSPLIVHVARIAQARALAGRWTDDVERLATALWPGPLTIVVPRGDVPDGVTGGRDSVAIRIPAHPVALELLSLASVPIVAPSANRYQSVSPTTAQHVAESLGDAVDAIVDGGPCPLGIESTVVSMLDDGPRILRIGLISADRIGAIVPGVVYVPTVEGAVPVDEAEPRSPGMSRRHYAPSGRIEIVGQLTSVFIDGDEQVGWLIRGAQPGEGRIGGRLTICLPDDPERYAAGLYAALHRFDAEGCTRILVERPPADVAWDAIRDRLVRASMPGESGAGPRERAVNISARPRVR